MCGLIEFMIAVIQRVKMASVAVDSEKISEIAHGLLILLGVCENDKEQDAMFLCDKISGFRIFSDENLKMNKSVVDVQGEILLVSQFTLCGDWRKGRRPSFIKAANPVLGESLYRHLADLFAKKGIPVKTGQFAAMMDVSLVNDGPVTFVMDTNEKLTLI